MRFTTKSIALLLLAATTATMFTGCFSAARRMARLERARQRYCAVHGGTTGSAYQSQEYFPAPGEPAEAEPNLFPGPDSVIPPAPSEPRTPTWNRRDEVPKSTNPMPLIEPVPPTRSAQAIPLPPSHGERTGRVL